MKEGNARALNLPKILTRGLAGLLGGRRAGQGFLGRGATAGAAQTDAGLTHKVQHQLWLRCCQLLEALCSLHRDCKSEKETLLGHKGA